MYFYKVFNFSSNGKDNYYGLKKLLSEMTLEEKMGQLFQLHSMYFVETDADLTGPLRKLGIDGDDLKNTGSTFGVTDAEHMLAMQKQYLESSPQKIPMIFMENVVHGHKTVYPIPLAMGGTFNPKLLEECSRMAAKESAISGIQVTFAPMLDLVRDARWGRVMESTGEDPYLNSVMAKAFTDGFQGDFKEDGMLQYASTILPAMVQLKQEETITPLILMNII